MAKSNEQKEQKLTPTKSSFKLMGKVVWMGKEGAFKEDILSNGKMAGSEYRSIRFGVQTSPTNIIPVEMFGIEQEKASMWNSKNQAYDKVDWDNRNDLPNGWILMDTTISLSRDSKNKLIKEHYANFDAVEKLHDELSDGDWIFASGVIDFNTYEKDGNPVTTTKYVLKSVSRLAKEIDFEADDFKEVSSFEMEVVVNGVDYNKETKTAYASVYTIQFGDKWSTGRLVVHGDTHEKLTDAFRKRLKPMDFIKVYGNCINATDTVEVEETEDDGWGSEKPNGYNNNMVRNVTRELRVTGVEASTHEPKKYKVEDFVTVTADSENPFAKKDDKKKETGKNNKEKDQDFGKNEPDDDDIPF